MKNLKVLLVVFLFSASGFLHAAQKIRIVTTTSDLASIARSVAGEAAEVKSICNGTEDPHFLQAKPGYIMAARNADLWIRVGLELEIGWEGPVLNGSRNTAIRIGAPGHLDVSAKALILEAPTERISRGMGDVHAMGNPHYWLDPWNGRVVAEEIATRLSSLCPDRADVFMKNLQRFRNELDELMFGKAAVTEYGGDKLWELALADKLTASPSDESEWSGGWMRMMKRMKDSPIVTYHRSWIYLANRFGLKVLDEIEPKPGIPPSAGHLSELAEKMKSSGATLVLQEPFYSRKAAGFLAGQTGARVVVAANSVGGEKGAGDYLSLIDLIISRLAGTGAAREEPAS